LLPAVGTGAISGSGLISPDLVALVRADLSNETPMGSLPDRRDMHGGAVALFGSLGFSHACLAAGYHGCTPLDMLLPDAEVQYVCRYAARQSHGRSIRCCCRCPAFSSRFETPPRAKRSIISSGPIVL